MSGVEEEARLVEEELAPKRVLITGATGFVGRHLLNLLQTSRFTVFGTSFPEHPSPWEENMVYLDLRVEREVYEVVKSLRPDWIFHLAAVSNVKHSWEKRRETMETNLMGLFFLLEACRRFQPAARILFISSSDVYGITVDLPLKKPLSEDDPIRLVNPYAFTKACGEWLCRFYVTCEGLDIVIARSFPHTGPGQSPDFVCSDWASQIARIERGETEPVLRVGNIDLERDYTDVRDTVRAYLLLMEKGRRGEVYNVCSGRAVQLRKIMEIMLQNASLEVRVEVDQTRLRKLDIQSLVGDNRKIRQETGWAPQIPLDKTIQDLLQYWREKRET